MSRLVLKNLHLFDEPSVTDLAIDGQHVVSSNLCPAGPTTRVFDLTGFTVLPAFVDSHTHLDRALSTESGANQSGTLDEAVSRYIAYALSTGEDQVYDRASRVVDMAVSHGTGALRTHSEVFTSRGLVFVDVLASLRSAVADRIELQIVAAPFEGEDRRAVLRLLERAVQHGADVVGGYPDRELDPRRFIDDVFSVALDLGVSLDFHVGEMDEADIGVLEYIAEKTISTGYEGRVTAGHCCSLDLVPPNVASRVIRKLQQARLNVVTLPSCNLFLMGRTGRHPVVRGITRVSELLRAGVCTAYASDNIRDPFRPFGNANMLEEGLLAAQVAQMGSPEQLMEVLRMGTHYPASILGLAGYGLKPGDYADLVAFKAPQATEALFCQTEAEFVLHRGKVVFGRLPGPTFCSSGGG